MRRQTINGKRVGSFTNPKIERSYEPKEASWEGIEIAPGDTIRVEFDTATNEADGWSRGRWTNRDAAG